MNKKVYLVYPVGRLIGRVCNKIPLLLGLIRDALGMFFYSVCRLPVHLALVRVLHGATGGMVSVELGLKFSSGIMALALIVVLGIRKHI